MHDIFPLHFLILLLISLLAVQAQSTKSSISSSSSISTSSTLATSYLDVASNLSNYMDNYFIPNVWNNNQELGQDLYLLNSSLVIFRLHNNKDYPSYYNDDMFDIDYLPIASLSHCIKSCAEYTVLHENDTGSTCQGVAYISGLCWRKSGFSEGSNPVQVYGAVSAIMHLLYIPTLN